MLNVLLNAFAAIGLLLEASFAPIGAGIAAFVGFGAAIGMGIAAGKAVEGTARQPEASGKIQRVLIIALAFIEMTALLGFVAAIMMMGQA